ncbi:AraC family transcriptional regulator [Solimonas sp. K1W22B-7]|uniref:AraC family transcriptional regulator n=1 Tax=Solimonas sp. K1W22B-7 TaxID=2303331 RepID=UPI0013C46B19|nr:AraC family transcriptional regulator [Solimonas sp. K1W22B-7]
MVTSGYGRSLLEVLRDSGRDPASICPPAWVAELESPESARVPLREWLRILESVSVALGEPELGLRVGASYVKLRHMGVLGQAVMSCATLEEGLQLALRYQRLHGDVAEPRVEVRGEQTHMSWVWPHAEPAPPLMVQLMQAARVTYVRWLTNRPDWRFDAWFDFEAPASTAAYSALFGGELRFGQAESRLVAPAAYLRAPIISADGEMRLRAEAAAQSLLKELAGETEFLRQLKTALTQRLAVRRVALEDAAAAMRLSPRALQRRLDGEGRSFRTILEEVRQARATHYLRDPVLSLAQVAFLLGYTEQSTFQSAFKQWTGESPGAFRKHLAAQGESAHRPTNG